MAITVYRHTDASAPTLTGQVGSMTSLLLACLVNGYVGKAAAGWTNPYNGTNQRVFRPASGVQHYFAVDDNAPGTAASPAEYGRLQGFEVMTAWATGTGPFPTTLQSSILVPFLKSATADATARPWVVVADGRTCYVFADLNHTTAQYASGGVPLYTAFAFGEFYSLMSVTDSYRSFVMGRNSETSTAGTADMAATLVQDPGANTIPSHYCPRDYTGIGGSTTAGKWSDSSRARNAITSTYGMGTGGLPLPDPVTGAIHLAPIHVDTQGNLRGRMRGLFLLCHAASAFADGDTIAGSGAYAGRTFLVVKNVQTSTTNGGLSAAAACVFDITGAWETN